MIAKKNMRNGKLCSDNVARLRPSLEKCIRPGDIAFDIDGVVADTVSLFIAIAEEEYRIENLRYEDITRYSLLEAPEMDPAIVKTIVGRLLAGRHGGRRLNLFDGAETVLRRLGALQPPILFVTARPDADAINQWICETVPLAETAVKVVATGSSDQKVPVLLAHGISYFVEDRLETCPAVASAGITPIVFRQPWNRHNRHFIEVASWDELEALIAFD